MKLLDDKNSLVHLTCPVMESAAPVKKVTGTIVVKLTSIGALGHPAVTGADFGHIAETAVSKGVADFPVTVASTADAAGSGNAGLTKADGGLRG